MNKITALFAPQAAQYQGMGRRWITEYKGINRRFEQASNLLQLDLIDLCINGESEKLQKTELSQIAIFTLSYSMYEQFCSDYNPNISYLAGHSLGEITALTAAGVFTFEDALKFVYERGRAMAICCSHNPSTMYAIRNIDSNTLETLLQEYNANEKGVFIANYNTPDQTILSGKVDDLEDFIDEFSNLVQYIPLPVSGAFHSVYMGGAANALKDVLNSIALHDFQIPVVNANEMRFYRKEDDIRQLLLDQIVKPVNWYKSLEMLKRNGTKLWIEFGPKDILRKTVISSVFNPRAYHYDSEDISPLLEEIDTIEKRNQKTPNVIGLCLGAAVSAKNNCQDDELYQNNVVASYNKIQDIYDNLQYENRKPSREEAEMSLYLLKLILDTKQVSEQERDRKINEIIEMANSVAAKRDDVV